MNNHIKILSKPEKTKIEKEMQKQFGIKYIPGLLFKTGTERIFLYQGSLKVKEIFDLANIIPLERIGVYFAKFQGPDIRLSIEGTHALKDQIKKNIFEIDEKQIDSWMHGSELNIATGKKGFLAIRYKNDFLGTGKASAEKITNFIPKSRRLKNKQS